MCWAVNLRSSGQVDDMVISSTSPQFPNGSCEVEGTSVVEVSFVTVDIGYIGRHMGTGILSDKISDI